MPEKRKMNVRRTKRPVKFILEKTIMRKAAKEREAARKVGSKPHEMLGKTINIFDKKIRNTRAKGFELDVKRQQNRKKHLTKLKRKAEQGTLSKKELQFAQFYSGMFVGGLSRKEAAKKAGLTTTEAAELMLSKPAQLAQSERVKTNVPAKEGIGLIQVNKKSAENARQQYILTPELQKKIDSAKKKLSLTTKKQVAEELIFDYGYSPEAVVKAFGKKSISREQLEKWGYAKPGLPKLEVLPELRGKLRVQKEKGKSGLMKLGMEFLRGKQVDIYAKEFNKRKFAIEMLRDVNAFEPEKELIKRWKSELEEMKEKKSMGAGEKAKEIALSEAIKFAEKPLPELELFEEPEMGPEEKPSRSTQQIAQPFLREGETPKMGRGKVLKEGRKKASEHGKTEKSSKRTSKSFKKKKHVTEEDLDEFINNLN